MYFLHITLPRLQIKNKSMKNRIHHQNDVICFRKICNKTNSFDWKKNTEDSIKDGIIITVTTNGIFFALKPANIKPPKASLDVMDIMKLAGGICEGVLVKDYAVYKKSTSDATKILWPPKGNKTTQRQMQIVRLILLIFRSRARVRITFCCLDGISKSWRPLTDINIFLGPRSSQHVPYCAMAFHFDRLDFFIFQWLKSGRDRWHSGGWLHLQD